MAGLWDLIEARKEYQIGEGVPWSEWDAAMMGVASRFNNQDFASNAARAIGTYSSLYKRVEDRPYTKSELITYLYQVCERFQIDRIVAYNQIQAESAFNPQASGPYCVLGVNNAKCAAGIAQFIPATAKAYGLADRFDPIKSFDAYGAYMSDLLQMWGGDYLKALASYNAGPGTVQKAIERNGDAWLSAMPAETKGYVLKILGERAIANPDVLADIQQSAEREGGTKIGWFDILTSDLGPDLLKRVALYVAGLTILFIALLPAVLRIYKEYKP